MKNSILKISIVLLLIINCQLSIVSYAQIAINSDGSNPDASAMLDVVSTNKGILIPRMTTTERNAIISPATGLMVYDNDENDFYYYNGTTWTTISNGVFTSESGVTSANNNSDDFVFGTDSLNFGTGFETKFFFDKDKGAFRAGVITNNNWDIDSLGFYSMALGYNNKANNNFSVALGNSTIASGAYATALGAQTTASGYISTAFGDVTTASGYYSTAFGRLTRASASYSTAFGNLSTASGDFSTAFGNNVKAPSYAETALGLFNTTYTPNNTASFDNDDRLLVVGNGTNSSNLSDALIIYKNGNTDLNGALKINEEYTFPTVDGTASQVLQTDGSGSLSWASLTDNDNQELSLSTNTLSLSGGSNTINLSGYLDNTDAQTLSFSGTTLTISGGNTANLSSLSDDLGNHSLTSNLKTSGKWISNDGDGEGIYIQANGSVGIGASFSNTTFGIQTNTTNPNAFGIANSSNNTIFVIDSLGRTSYYGNILTNSNWISGDGNNEGIYVYNDGQVLMRSSETGSEEFVATIHNTANNNSERNEGLEILAGHNSYNSSHQSSFIHFSRPDGTYCGRVAQDGSTSVDYRQASDRRLKENIVPTNYGLADLMKIRVVNYDFIGDQSDKPHTGFIAQELHTAFPPAVTVGGKNPKKNPWEVSYGSVVPLVVKAVQEQEKAIEDLRIENEKLKKSNKALKAQVAKITDLEQQNVEMKAMLEQIQAQLNQEN